MKRIEFEGTTHEFPDDFSDADIATALGGGRAPAGPSMGQRISAGLGTAKGAVQRGLDYIDTLGGTLKGTRAGAPTSRGFIAPADANPIPGTLTEAGGQLGQAVIPGAAVARSGLGAGWQALARVLGPAIGGEIGNQLEGGQTGRGALTQGGGALLGEAIGQGVGGAGGAILRGVSNNSIAGGKRNIANNYQATVGRTIGELIPELGTPRTGEDFAALARLARGTRLPPGMSQQPGHEELLGGMLDTAAANINQLVGPRGLNITQVPPGALPATVPPAGAATLLNAQGQPIQGTAASAGSAVPFDQALGLLRQLYGRAYHGGVGATNPAIAALDPTAAKQAADVLKQEITAELQRLSPEARNLFQTSQNKYAMGTEIAADIDQALRLSPNRTELTEPALQQTVFNRLGDVSAKLGRQRVAEDTPGDALTKYLAAVYNRGGLGKTIPATGTGNIGDSFRRAFLQGQGGTPSAIAAVPKAVAENAGAVYTGQKPYSGFTLPPVLQQALDVVLQRTGSGLAQPSP